MNEKKSHIPGIYNYCDRWCEKCGFTSKCLLFTNESKITTQEILNDGAVPDIEKIFEETFEDAMEDEGEDFDFDDFDFDEEDDDWENSFGDDESESERRDWFAEVKKYPLSILGDEYFKKANKLIKTLTAKYNVSDSENKIKFSSDSKRIFDYYEIVNWYHMFIKVKIDRALQGKMEYLHEDDEEMKDIHAYDMNGTAKIASIAVDNSVNALNKLHGYLPSYENAITDLLIISGKLKNMIDEEFPGHQSFIRPGLDE